MARKFQIHAEKLAYWYFRLNGFLVFENFVVHGENPARHLRQETDVDILGARFPFRGELHQQPMIDDQILTHIDGKKIEKISLIAAEVKYNGACKFNETLRNPDRKNIQRILRAVGICNNKELERAAKEIYKTGQWQNRKYILRLVAVAEQKNPQFLHEKALQITWEEILNFIHERFFNYRFKKNDHPQWDIVGKKLFEFSMEFNNTHDFIKAVDVVDQSPLLTQLEERVKSLSKFTLAEAKKFIG